VPRPVIRLLKNRKRVRSNEVSTAGLWQLSDTSEQLGREYRTSEPSWCARGFFSLPPEGAGASAMQLLSRVLIRIQGRCGDQLRRGSSFPFLSLQRGPCLHGNDGRAHWEHSQGTGGPVVDAPIRGGP
jgi:hypothetical protein